MLHRAELRLGRLGCLILGRTDMAQLHGWPAVSRPNLPALGCSLVMPRRDEALVGLARCPRPSGGVDWPDAARRDGDPARGFRQAARHEPQRATPEADQGVLIPSRSCEEPQAAFAPLVDVARVDAPVSSRHRCGGLRFGGDGRGDLGQPSAMPSPCRLARHIPTQIDRFRPDRQRRRMLRHGRFIARESPHRQNARVAVNDGILSGLQGVAQVFPLARLGVHAGAIGGGQVARPAASIGSVSTTRGRGAADGPNVTCHTAVTLRPSSRHLSDRRAPRDRKARTIPSCRFNPGWNKSFWNDILARG